VSGARLAPARLVRQSAAEAVAEHLRRLVFDGVLRQGDRIPQQEIADALGVSRIPVREALVALERDGVVRIEPHRGAFVNAFDAAAIEDHYELYGLIYGHAARRSAERATPEQVAELARVQAGIEAARDAEELFERATRFRDVVYRLGGSPRLRALLTALGAIVPGNFFAVIPGSAEVARRGFAAMLEAIRVGDGDAAAARCREMLRAHGANVVRHLAQRGLFELPGG
jgi:DNA-binding GntR family transcriptional regulator